MTKHHSTYLESQQEGSSENPWQADDRMWGGAGVKEPLTPEVFWQSQPQLCWRFFPSYIWCLSHLAALELEQSSLWAQRSKLKYLEESKLAFIL